MFGFVKSHNVWWYNGDIIGKRKHHRHNLTLIFKQNTEPKCCGISSSKLYGSYHVYSSVPQDQIFKRSHSVRSNRNIAEKSSVQLLELFYVTFYPTQIHHFNFWPCSYTHSSPFWLLVCSSPLQLIGPGFPGGPVRCRLWRLRSLYVLLNCLNFTESVAARVGKLTLVW